MFASANAVPASTVTRTATTTADTIAFRDNHFFIVILLEIIDAPSSCAALVRSRQHSMRRSIGVHDGLSLASLQLTRGHSGNIYRSHAKSFRENELPAAVTYGQGE